MANPMRSGNGQAGFTYVGLLIAVALIALTGMTVLEVGTQLQRRAQEAELLAIGQEFRAALKSYAEATPLGQPDAPQELAELLRDPRHPGTKRHLRRIYPDPLTGNKTWGVVRAPDGRVLGIHSLDTTPTLRRSGFPVGLEAFAQAHRHDEWVFALQPVPIGAAASVTVARH
ncbi:type II secretion system protein [Sulfuricystis multivorans]|uniref:type II secretion system protein n=1 Tax=Sulfuricystis multivorans TaxID=2211108 RepID=UPI000F8445B5|nr:type II secretion system protein [Sulfuricystis multivorans]